MLIAKIYPNGEFSLYPEQPRSGRKRPSKDGRNPLSRCDRYERGSDGIIRLVESPTASLNPTPKPSVYAHHSGSFFVLSKPVRVDRLAGEYHYRRISKDGVIRDLVLCKPVEQMAVWDSTGVPPQFVRFMGILPPLVHQMVHSSDDSSKPRNRKPLKFSGRRKIRNLTHCLQESIGKHNLAFLTITIPNLSPEFLSLCRQNWGFMISQLIDAISAKYRRLYGKAIPYVSVTEIQEKRFNKYGQIAPHEHMVFHARKPDGSWLFSPSQIRKIWFGIVKRCLSAKLLHGLNRADFSASENLRVVRKDASRYLSKYLSKGSGGGLNHSRNEYSKQSAEITGRWYRASRGLYKQVFKSIRIIKNIPTEVIYPLRLTLCARGYNGRSVGRFHESVISFISVSTYKKEKSCGCPDGSHGIRCYTGWLPRPDSREYRRALEILHRES